MIDSHCHLDREPLLSNLSQVLIRAKDAGVKKLGTFPSRSPSCALQEQSIFTAVGDTVEKRNLSGGSVLTTLSFTEAEGRPMHMDANGKFLFPSQSLMMREKVNIYKQFAQLLLGESTSRFTAPFSNSGESDEIDEALFLSFKRLFVRDGIKRETFAIKMFQSSCYYS